MPPETITERKCYVLEIDTLFGNFVCAFAIGLGVRSGNLGDATDLCMFIFKYDL